MMFFIVCLLSLAFPAASEQGLDVFKKGAEISAYKTLQPCFGELKEGTTVLIFNPEMISRSTRLKFTDLANAPKEDQVQVICFGRSLKFKAGLEDYSAMTSVFSATGFALGRDPFYPLKIAMTVADWSGSLYQHLVMDGKGARRELHSYVQTEGDKSDYLAEPGEDAYYEDDLPVIIRELNGLFIRIGQKKECRIMSSLWQSRVSGRPLVFEPGVIEKKMGKRHLVGNDVRNSTCWSWQVAGRTVEYWVDQKYPHCILEWKDSEGGQGQLLRLPVCTPYWEERLNKDLGFRKQLGLER
jgi:hypothetical protein